ncbi:hypothetical protein [Embleya sp. NPDC005575]
MSFLLLLLLGTAGMHTLAHPQRSALGGLALGSGGTGTPAATTGAPAHH